MWEPDACLDDFMPEVTKQRAKEYLMKNDELSSWFLDQYKESEKIDAAGNVVNFLTVKDILARYQSQPIFLLAPGH